MVNHAKFQQAMTASIFEVLETMFFTPIDHLRPVSDSAAAGKIEHPIAVELSFGGPFGGCFRLWIPEALARTISADFLGVGRGCVSTAEVLGAVQEMVNMVAGNTLSIYDYRDVFNIRCPEIIQAAEAPRQDPQTSVCIRLMIEASRQRMLFASVVQN